MSTKITAPTSQEITVAHVQQLKETYARAVGGMEAVVLCGAMLLTVQENIVSELGHDPKAGRKITAGGGLWGWLKANTPEIQRGNAYRFMAIAQGILDEFKIASAPALAALVSGTGNDLDAKGQKSRQLVFDFIADGSVNGLLSRLGKIAPDTTPDSAGKRHPAKAKNDPAEAGEITAREAVEKGRHLIAFLADVCPRGALPAEAAETLAADLAAGLEKIHLHAPIAAPARATLARRLQALAASLEKAPV